MITVYKVKSVPKNMEIIRLNDVYFNKYTAMELDERAGDIIKKIDRSEWIDQYTIKSRFDGTILNIDKLSTGCKTVLNILYYPKKIFDIRECGDNALDVIYSLPAGNVWCDYPLISFDMTEVNVHDKKGSKVISGYEELKEWWTSED